MTKKVIFLNGTRYSGSTFFHLTLANDPKGFAVGEVYGFFHPTLKNHLRSRSICTCGDPSCKYWEKVKKRGDKHIYESIFELNPDIDFIVDSSKNPYWFEEQGDRLARQGIEVYNLAIWKTLHEFGHSLRKRNFLHGGVDLTGWTKTYRTQYSFIDKWRSIKYLDYIQNQAAVLKATCDYLHIPYFDGKTRFWEKSFHTFGGNLTAKLQLFDQGSPGYQNVKQGAGTSELLNTAESNFRKIYYEDPNQKELDMYIQRLREIEPRVDQIEDMLIAHDVAKAETPGRLWPDLQQSRIEMEVRRLRQHGKAHFGAIKYGYQNWLWERKLRATPKTTD